MAARKRTNKQSKADFVRSLPASMPAEVVMEKAKAAGLDISRVHVYSIRSTSKRMTGARGGPKPAMMNGTIMVSASKEATFRRLVFELGIERAKELVAQVERAIDVVVGRR